MRKFETLLVSAVSQVSGINLQEHKIKGSSRKLWDGVKGVQEHRNKILHKAIEAKEEEASPINPCCLYTFRRDISCGCKKPGVSLARRGTGLWKESL
jgi:hypothetical protein